MWGMEENIRKKCLLFTLPYLPNPVYHSTVDDIIKRKDLSLVLMCIFAFEIDFI